VDKVIAGLKALSDGLAVIFVYVFHSFGLDIDPNTVKALTMLIAAFAAFRFSSMLGKWLFIIILFIVIMGAGLLAGFLPLG